MLRLRSHPSLLMWLNGSDNPPPHDREVAYLNVEKETHWNKPVISSATAKETDVTGKTGVKMSGPYEYVPANYWTIDTKNGGAYGFNTETSPGPAVPPLEELETFIPEDKLWPVSDVWNFHAGGGQFKNIGIFSAALEKRYGEAKNASDFAWKSQAMAYEGQRAMFEAYGRNKYKSTGVIQWMLNNAWPGLIWHLYSYDLRPAAGYFGSKKALEPVHAISAKRSQGRRQNLRFLDGRKIFTRSRCRRPRGRCRTLFRYPRARWNFSDLFPRAAALFVSRPARKPQFLLAFHATGRAQSRQNRVVLHAAVCLLRFHRASNHSRSLREGHGQSAARNRARRRVSRHAQKHR
jgi:hypothetical protein